MTPKKVFNILVLKGPKDEIEKFRSHAEGIDPSVIGRFHLNDLCFNNFVALPKRVIQGTSIISLEESRKQLWGCATDALGLNVDQPDKYTLRYTFTTGAAAPYKVLNTIRKLYGDELNIDHKVA